MKKISTFLICFGLLCSKAHAFSVDHQFKVLVGPFDASRTAFSYTLNPDTFEVKSGVKTFGVFNTLYPFKADYATSGKIKNNALLTKNYQYKSQTRFNSRSKQLVYDDKGTILYRLSSKNGKKKKVSIAADDKNANTTDFQSVFAELAKQYNKVRFCDSKMEVFDGKKRFNVIFKDEGIETLVQTEHSPFSGQASKCSMYIDKLDTSEDDMLMQISAEKPIYFWIMEQENKPFISRISINDTPLGAIDVYAQKVSLTKD